MPVELREIRNAAIIGHSGGYFTQGLLVLLVERMVRFISRVAALLLKLLLMREMAVNVVVQELYGAAHLGASLAGAACVKQRVDGVQEFTVKSLRRTGIFTAFEISARYSSLPLNQNGSVRQEIAEAPALS